ncbi:MAG: hypothetical protein GTN46_10640 [Gammaproteobacteria bacterium]|nr:hypothetical protein [Gammaproteobacteria bacterium]NIT06444.1 hypothetical protein [Gammaproteobacteria bacterium]NIT41915.1 hypothetical protein [Gammaproteobacteria bacterium]
MKPKKMNAWLTLVANFGVIAGLIFLGYEIRQNTTQLRAEALYSINEAISMLNAGIYSDSVLADIKVRGEADFSPLNQIEREQFIMYQFDRINLAELYLALKDEGLTDIHFPFDQFLIRDFRSKPGLQQFLKYVDEDWEGSRYLYDQMLVPEK